MKVRFQIAIAGPDVSYRPGEIVDLPEDLARKWSAVGHVEILEDETAESPAEETATARPQRSRKRR